MRHMPWWSWVLRLPYHETLHDEWYDVPFKGLTMPSLDQNRSDSLRSTGTSGLPIRLGTSGDSRGSYRGRVSHLGFLSLRRSIDLLHRPTKPWCNIAILSALRKRDSWPMCRPSWRHDQPDIGPFPTKQAQSTASVRPDDSLLTFRSGSRMGLSGDAIIL